jgi:hypothetical protein
MHMLNIGVPGPCARTEAVARPILTPGMNKGSRVKQHQARNVRHVLPWRGSTASIE